MISSRTMEWGRLAAVIGVIAGVCLLYWPAMYSLGRVWMNTDNPTYTHGYLIAAICLWLLIRDRQRIAATPVQPQPWVALLLLGAALVWLVAYRSAIQIAFQAPMPAMMWGAIWAVFGWRMARQVWFPVAYLYFAIPLWDYINPLAQWGSVFAARLLLRATNVTAYFDGEFVHLPSGTFQIAGGCSGLNILIVALALAFLLGKLREEPWRVRMKIVALAVVCALIANWTRVYTIILAGYLTDMQHYLVRVDHNKYGWMLFAIMLVPFFLIARRMSSDVPPPESAARSAPGRTQVSFASLGAVFFTAAVLAVPAAWEKIVEAGYARAASLSSLPVSPPGWSGPAVTPTDWKPAFLNADETLYGVYEKDGRQVEMYSAIFRTQRQGKELGGYGSSITGQGFATISSGQASAAGRDFIELQVKDPAGHETVLWGAYAVGNRWFADATRAQLWYGVRSLGGPRLSRAVILRARCAPGCQDARQLLEDFIGQGVIE